MIVPDLFHLTSAGISFPRNLHVGGPGKYLPGPELLKKKSLESSASPSGVIVISIQVSTERSLVFAAIMRMHITGGPS